MSDRYYYRDPLDPKAVARARRAARSIGWRVEKSRERYQHNDNKGGLRIVTQNNIPLCGTDYDLNPEDVVWQVQRYVEYDMGREHGDEIERLEYARRDALLLGYRLMHRRNGRYWLMHANPLTLPEIEQWITKARVK